MCPTHVQMLPLMRPFTSMFSFVNPSFKYDHLFVYLGGRLQYMSVLTPGIFLAHNSFLTLVSILRLHIGVDIEGNYWNIDEWRY